MLRIRIFLHIYLGVPCLPDQENKGGFLNSALSNVQSQQGQWCVIIIHWYQSGPGTPPSPPSKARKRVVSQKHQASGLLTLQCPMLKPVLKQLDHVAAGKREIARRTKRKPILEITVVPSMVPLLLSTLIRLGHQLVKICMHCSAQCETALDFFSAP